MGELDIHQVVKLISALGIVRHKPSHEFVEAFIKATAPVLPKCGPRYLCMLVM